jgi:hypothetical protein
LLKVKKSQKQIEGNIGGFMGHHHPKTIKDLGTHLIEKKK